MIPEDDPSKQKDATAEKHRQLLIILTMAGVLLPLLLAALRLLGYI